MKPGIVAAWTRMTLTATLRRERQNFIFVRRKINSIAFVSKVWVLER
jgi:hypothetical protein